MSRRRQLLSADSLPASLWKQRADRWQLQPHQYNTHDHPTPIAPNTLYPHRWLMGNSVVFMAVRATVPVWVGRSGWSEAKGPHYPLHGTNCGGVQMEVHVPPMLEAWVHRHPSDVVTAEGTLLWKDLVTPVSLLAPVESPHSQLGMSTSLNNRRAR